MGLGIGLGLALRIAVKRWLPLLILFATSTALPQVTTPVPKSPKPLRQDQVLKLMQNYVPSARLAYFVKQRGIDFEPTEGYLRALREVGAEEVLLEALRAAKPAKLQAAEANAATRAAQIQQHLGRGADLERQQLWSQAEQEYRPALHLDGENAAIHLALGRVLIEQKRIDEAIAEYRETLRLQPDSAEAHRQLSMALFQKHDLNGAIAEQRQALRLKADDARGRLNLGLALYVKGDLEGAISEYRQAVRLDPGDAKARGFLGNALARKADLNGAIAEFREAVRLEPDLAAAHYNLGTALEHKGDRQGALSEYRIAHQLDPEDADTRVAYDRYRAQADRAQPPRARHAWLPWHWTRNRNDHNQPEPASALKASTRNHP